MNNKPNAHARTVHTRSAAAVKSRKRMKNRIYILCFALAAVFLIASALLLRGMTERQAYNDYMSQAQELYMNSDFDNALVMLRKAAALESTDECLMLMASCYETQGNYTKALEVLRMMDTKNSAVASRISSIEAYRQTLSEAEKVTVAGRQYALNTSSLVLDNMGLNDSVLQELTQLYSLDSLSLNANSITNISPLAQLGGLVTLNLSGNNVSDISVLASLPALRTLYLDNNPITDLSPLYSLSSLTSLSIKGIAITESQLQNLSRALPNCAIHSEDAKEEVQDISFGGLTFKSDVEELDLSGMGLKDISGVAGCEKLRKLNISGNEVSDLSPLMNLPELEWLDISNTQVMDLRPLMGIEGLTYLNASGCNISSTTPLTMMNGLTQLYLDDNPIGDFSGLRKVKSLMWLGLSNTNLTDEGISYLRSLSMLTSLDIEENFNITGEAVDSLRSYIPACTIKHSELAYVVDFDNHVVKSDTKQLSLPGQGIVDISAVSKLKNLETVDLSANFISNLYPLEAAECRFTIRELNLSRNAISDITPVSMLMNVEVLDLSYNNISSELALMRLYTLDTLILTGNPLSEMQVESLRNTLLDCNIIF